MNYESVKISLIGNELGQTQQTDEQTQFAPYFSNIKIDKKNSNIKIGKTQAKSGSKNNEIKKKIYDDLLKCCTHIVFELFRIQIHSGA